MTELREHVFDGIQEMDSRLPNWWLWTFYGACIYSVFYWIHYHTLATGNLPMQSYMLEQKVAADRLAAELAKNPMTEGKLLELAANPAFVGEGEKIFKDPNRCAQCHGPTANGITAAGVPGAGPNLTDAFWLNGGKPMEIYNTVMNGGRPDKGMIAWGKEQGPLFVQRAVAYVLSLRNTNVPGKPPEPEAKEVK
jgi:cytochrome c oxidase cbb3-type subunit 3